MNRTIELNASVVRYAPGAVLEPHSHGSASVSLVISGSIEEWVGSRAEVGEIGCLVAKPADVVHGNRVGGEGAVLLAIKGEEVDPVAAEGWRWTQSTSAAALGLRLARGLNAGVSADPEELLDLLAYAGVTAPPLRRPSWLDQVVNRLDREAEPLPVSELARGVEVHPVYLARAFRQHFRCSIREYRRRKRVRRAARLLVGSDLSIAAIAARLDFFDQSHLCRDFRAELAVSPSDYRAIVRS